MQHRRAWIPLTDGTRLAARLCLPDGLPAPVLLEALPYRKDDLTASYASEYRRSARRGPVRRLPARPARHRRVRRDRDDEYPAQEQADLVEVIAWLAAQRLVERASRDVRHVVLGLQLAAARGRAAAGARGGRAIYATDDRYTDDVHYMGGALKAIDLVDYVLYMAAMVALPPMPALAGDGWRDAWAERVDQSRAVAAPLARGAVGRAVLAARLAAARDDATARGWATSASRCPTMIVAGWADGYRNNSFRTFERLPAPARAAHRPVGRT